MLDSLSGSLFGSIWLSLSLSGSLWLSDWIYAPTPHFNLLIDMIMFMVITKMITIIIMVIIFFILVISSIVVIFDYLVTSSALSRILIRQNSMKFPFLIFVFRCIYIFFLFSVQLHLHIFYVFFCFVMFWPEYDWVWGAAYSTEPSDRVQRCWVHLAK